MKRLDFLLINQHVLRGIRHRFLRVAHEDIQAAAVNRTAGRARWVPVWSYIQRKLRHKYP